MTNKEATIKHDRATSLFFAPKLPKNKRYGLVHSIAGRSFVSYYGSHKERMADFVPFINRAEDTCNSTKPKS